MRDMLMSFGKACASGLADGKSDMLEGDENTQRVVVFELGAV